MDIEPIELARARYNLHVLGRHLVAGSRRFITAATSLWLSLAVIMMAAGGGLITYIGSISENSISDSSLISLAIFYHRKEADSDTYSAPQITINEPHENIRLPKEPSGRGAKSLGIEFQTNGDAVVLISANIDPNDCDVDAKHTDPHSNSPEALYFYITRTILKDAAQDYAYVVGDGIKYAHMVPMYAISISSDDPDKQIDHVYIDCQSVIRPTDATFVERQIRFHYAQFTILNFSTKLLELIGKHRLQLYDHLILIASEFENYEGFHLAKAKQLSETEVKKLKISPDAVREISDDFPEFTMNWRDTEHSLRRDVILLIGGAIFGLAGAFFVEWIKDIKRRIEYKVRR